MSRYQVTAKFLVDTPDGGYARAAEKLVHGIVQDAVYEVQEAAESGDIMIIGASAEETIEVVDYEGSDLVDPDEKVLVCSDCKSTDIQRQMWVHQTSGEVVDDTGRYAWCNACERDGFDGIREGSSSLEEIPRKETREWKEAHGEQVPTRTDAG
jgi:hypothetical protein